jgi:hypothetical protein
VSTLGAVRSISRVDSRGIFHKAKALSIGENSPKHKITEQNAIEIYRRRCGGETAVSLANQFGVNDRTVAKIYKKQIWKHIHNPRGQ